MAFFIPLVILGVFKVFLHNVGLTLLGERRRTECAVYFPSPPSFSLFFLMA